MKKFTLFTLLAAVAFSTNAVAQKHKVVTDGSQQYRKMEQRNVTTTKEKTTIKVVKVVKKKTDVPEGYARITLVAGDVWSDGSGYQMLIDADHNAYGDVIPETGPLTSGGDASDEQYAAFEYKIPENADGACSTTNIIFNSSGTITIPAGIYDYVIVNPSPEDRVWIPGVGGTGASRADDFAFESECEYIFTMGMHGSGDGADLTINDPRDAAMPTNVTATPDMTTAEVKWRSTETQWNIRYRPFVLPSEIIYDFTLDNYSEQVAEWKIVDADGDGKNWGLAYTTSANDDVCLYSASWTSDDGALKPDNWLITPSIPLGGSISFNAWSVSASYPENFSVYVYEGDEWTGIDDFVALQENIEAPGDATYVHEFDLREYSGNGFIAIRHHNSTDQFQIKVDNFVIVDPAGGLVPDWTYVNDVTTNPYTLTGLTPSTEYEVQVQGVRTDTNRQSDWTESVHFTTLDDPTGINNLNNDEKTGSKVYYNLAGQRVSGNLPAGVYINNGKKVIVK